MTIAYNNDRSVILDNVSNITAVKIEQKLSSQDTVVLQGVIITLPFEHNAILDMAHKGNV